MSDSEFHTADDGAEHTKNHTLSPLSAKERFERALRGKDKPKTREAGSKLHGISNEEKTKRELAVRKCVKLGLAISTQMKHFLPTWGFNLSESQIHGYYENLDLPRRDRNFYEKRKKSERSQGPHDRYCNRLLVRLARDAEQPFREIFLNKPAYYRARFRPDIAFRVLNYLFYVEVQLEPLPEAKWIPKLKNYLRWFGECPDRFRVLFFVKEGDVLRIRQHARQLLKEKGLEESNLFLFLRLEEHMTEPNGRMNLMHDPVWQTPWSSRKEKHLSLLKYARRLDQKSVAHRQ